MKRSRNEVTGRAELDMIMTVDELAQYLRVHATTIYRLLKKNKIPAFRVGSDWRFDRREIHRWMLSHQK
jgi:excisionase family DNA binding protein